MSNDGPKRRGMKPGTKVRRWNATEDAQLKHLARTQTTREIGRALTRNISSVVARARKLGVELRLTPRKRAVRKSVAAAVHTATLREELLSALGGTDMERDEALVNLAAEDRFVAQQILAGVTSTDIAERRGVGISTVSHQISRLVQRLRDGRVAPLAAARVASTPAHLLGQAKSARLQAALDAARVRSEGDALARRKEREAAVWALREAGGDVSAAARLLGLTDAAYRKLGGTP